LLGVPLASTTRTRTEPPGTRRTVSSTGAADSGTVTLAGAWVSDRTATTSGSLSPRSIVHRPRSSVTVRRDPMSGSPDTYSATLVAEVSNTTSAPTTGAFVRSSTTTIRSYLAGASRIVPRSSLPARGTVTSRIVCGW
jgi:hypothetical protein